jgi:hypothetical protein
MLRQTDAKQIGIMYGVTAFAFFLIGGVMALLMRAELAQPDLQFLSPEQYNQLFTMHGTIMLLLFATPIVFAFANYIVPLQIGAPDVAFPRLNAFAYWLFALGGTIVLLGFVTPGGAADFGWFSQASTRSRPACVAGVRCCAPSHRRWSNSRCGPGAGPLRHPRSAGRGRRRGQLRPRPDLVHTRPACGPPPGHRPGGHSP